MKIVKSKIYNLIRDDDVNNLASNIFDFFIISLIIINVVLVIADTFNLPNIVQQISNKIEVSSVLIFTIEYLLRLWTSDFIYPQKTSFQARFKYAFSFIAIIDLLAILPFYIPFLIPIDLRILRVIRIIRLLRIFKFNRYTDAFSIIGRVLKNKASQLMSSIFVVITLVIITSVLMYNFENVAQPDKFRNVFDGMWWAVATFTTVGYGDIYPVTAVGKILSGIIAMLGIGLVAVPTGIISAGFVEQIQSSENDEKKYCPYCGKKL